MQMYQPDLAIVNNGHWVKSIRVSPDGYNYINTVASSENSSAATNAGQTQQIINDSANLRKKSYN